MNETSATAAHIWEHTHTADDGTVVEVDRQTDGGWLVRWASPEGDTECHGNFERMAQIENTPATTHHEIALAVYGYFNPTPGRGCPSCGVQLNEDGTVDKLDDESDSHFSGCAALFVVVARQRTGQLVSETRAFQYYGMALDFMQQRRAMTGPRLTWAIAPVVAS